MYVVHPRAMRRDLDSAVAALARDRGGAFRRSDLRAIGVDGQLERRRRAAGRWIDEGAGVLTLADHPRSIEQRRWVGLLAGGDAALLAFEGAADLHRLEGVRRGLVVVTVDHPLHLRLQGITYHQLDDVLAAHRTTLSGYPVTTAARTIVDLAAVLGFVRLQAAVQDAVIRRLTTFGEIARVLRTVRRRGKPGVRKLLLVLDSLAGEPPPASEAERLLHLAARRAGVTLVRQHPLPGRAHVVGLVDGAVLPSRLVLEADSRTWHGRLQAMAKDRARDREAARAGWLTMRFLHEELAHDLAGCADDIRTTHLGRLAVRSRGSPDRDAIA
jgi:very-short-patch-repair endonuclease